MERLDPRKISVFFDFDNTITTYDILDDLLLNFSRDDKWEDLEKKWKAGKIGSRECLKGQVEGIDITRNKLDEYLKKVRLDPYFKKLLAFLKSHDIKTVVLSDNFDYILNRVLLNNGIKNLDFYSNNLEFNKGRIIPHFIYTDQKCGSCAHCKKANLLANLKKGHKAAYIGDGFSDICASKISDIVFAKDSLLKYCKKHKMPHVPYRDLKDVYSYFKEKIER